MPLLKNGCDIYKAYAFLWMWVLRRVSDCLVTKSYIIIVSFLCDSLYMFCNDLHVVFSFGLVYICCNLKESSKK